MQTGPSAQTLLRSVLEVLARSLARFSVISFVVTECQLKRPRQAELLLVEWRTCQA